MMNMMEEAVVYAIIMRQGKVRKFECCPYIPHPMGDATPGRTIDSIAAQAIADEECEAC